MVMPAQIEILEHTIGAGEQRRDNIALRRGISTSHSGSPNRTLYSISFGPVFVIIRPANSTPLNGRAAFFSFPPRWV